MAETLKQTILRMLAERNGATLDPTEVARFLAGSDEQKWRLKMTPIRREAMRLAEAGRIELRRKGRAVAPGELRGLYRIAAVGTPSDEGAGNKASVLPVSR